MSTQLETRNRTLTIRNMLEDPNTVARMRAVVPAFLTAERLVKLGGLAIHKNPKLGECNPISLLGALLACGSLGLEPNTPLGHAHLVPFKNDVQLIIGYQGLVDLARRSGHLVSIHADVVYEGDQFSFEYGSRQELRHLPSETADVSKPRWAYCFAKLDIGEEFVVFPYQKVLDTRKSSVTYKYNPDNSLWTTHTYEMVCKTMIRRLAKILPLSADFARAVRLDTKSDAGTLDFGKFYEQPSALQDPDLADRVPEASNDATPPETPKQKVEKKAEQIKGNA